jgi:hypothetical protein
VLLAVGGIVIMTMRGGDTHAAAPVVIDAAPVANVAPPDAAAVAVIAPPDAAEVAVAGIDAGAPTAVATIPKHHVEHHAVPPPPTRGSGAGSGGATTVAAADPPVTDTASLTARYKAVGHSIDALIAARGEDVGAPFKRRYLAIPYVDALRTPSLRAQVAQQLSALAHEVAAQK